MARRIWYIVAALITAQAHAGIFVGGSLGYEIADVTLGYKPYNASVTMAEKALVHSFDIGYRHHIFDNWSLSIEGQFMPFKGRGSRNIQVDFDIDSTPINLFELQTQIVYQADVRLIPTWHYSPYVDLLFPFGVTASKLHLTVTELGSKTVKKMVAPAITAGAGVNYHIDDNYTVGLICNIGKFNYSNNDVSYKPFQNRIMLRMNYEL